MPVKEPCPFTGTGSSVVAGRSLQYRALPILQTRRGQGGIPLASCEVVGTATSLVSMEAMQSANFAGGIFFILS
ncbi:hypothetical protein RC74_10880 [Falsihalocynthiibacter arcticus]|uniref:Uncharacterized protein n=1 Tax=Falsihalocynthiibacter arcticus TaxID=1579316 RepID=A0A126V1Y7_9RHOB|nr:hypothetical protein RC74_10880 [Falsihalocynthiibacter arcticus]